MREIEGRKNNNQQQQQSQSPRIPITQQYQPQSTAKQQQHQREVVLQPKQLDIQKSLPPAFGHPTKPRMVQNPPTVDVSSAQQAPRTFKMFSPSKGIQKEIFFFVFVLHEKNCDDILILKLNFQILSKQFRSNLMEWQSVRSRRASCHPSQT